MSHGLSNAATFPPKRQMTEEKTIMKAIVVTDQDYRDLVTFFAKEFNPGGDTAIDRKIVDYIKSRVENILENETDLATTAISESAHPRASHALTAGVRVFGVSHCHIDGTMMGQKKCPCLLALSHLSHCLIIFQKGVNRKKHAPQKRGRGREFFRTWQSELSRVT